MVHGEMSPLARTIELASIVIAPALLVAHALRFAAADQLVWWWLLPVGLGWIAADFGSGLVHWAADTWGSETMPILGRRFVRPFRVHHQNPEDLLQRDFIDTNGDVAMVETPLLALAFLIPLNTDPGQAAAFFLVALCAVGLPTNQVHQWAHMSDPPRIVRRLQQWGLVLGRPAHARHHAAPYTVNYCIATGWCNRALTSLRFFPRLETLVSRATGLQPRSDVRG
jgi:hypothetical protein